MIEKHIQPSLLRQKIEDLFSYRLFPELLQGCARSTQNQHDLWEQLIGLQTAIYHLDAHLEAHMNPDSTILEWHHKSIEQKLEKIIGQLPERHTYFDDINMYERHELNLRKIISPLSYDMMMFYYYKSCDVKLLRRLIYEKCEQTESWGSLESWKAYDLITEVNDDVEDIWEDQAFINGNLFLISLLIQGKQDTEDMFHSFMDTIEQVSHDMWQAHPSPRGHYLHQMTLKRIEETRVLMSKQWEDDRMTSVQTARITALTNTMKASAV